MTEPAPLRCRLTRAMRLRRRGEFAQLRETGRRLTKGCLIANWRPLPAGATPRLGVITTRKLGSAIVRSRARRLLRETFRLHQHDFRHPIAMVLVARASIAGKGFSEVERDLLAVLRNGGLLNEYK